MKASYWLIVALTLTLFMPGNDSLWIDEAQTAAYAQLPTWNAFMHRLQEDKFSEAQMPLGMAVFWVGEKIFGYGEWQLRAVNSLFTAATIWILWLIGLRYKTPALALLGALHPAVWYYTNEARPYALQIAGGAALVLVAIRITEEKRLRTATTFLWSITVLALCASSMLAVIPAAIASCWFAYFIVSYRRKVSWTSLAVICLTGALILLLGCYYLGTLRRGTGGAFLWPVSINNLFFSGYELAGFAGLGPARQTLREAFASGSIFPALAPYLLPLAFFALATTFLFLLSLFWLKQLTDRRQAYFFFGLPVATGATLFLLAYAVHWPFWGRHLAALIPFLVVLLTLPSLHQKRYIALIAWAALCFLSAAELRYAPRHAKDDNRSAARLARLSASEGKTVWWCADQRAAEYYGLTFGGAITLAPVTPVALPDLVITSKPDVFDPAGKVSFYLGTNGYRVTQTFQAMKVWQR